MEERIEHLERRLRRRAYIEFVIFGLAALVVWTNLRSVDHSIHAIGSDLMQLHEGFATGIKSQQFLLLNPDGEIRGYLTGADGRGAIVLLDGEGRTRIVADAGDEQPGFELLGPDGKARVSLLVDDAGNSVLIRSAKPESQAAIQAVVGETGPRLRLQGKDGEWVPAGF